MGFHDKARWFRPVNQDSVVPIPASDPLQPDCGESVPILGETEVDAEALWHDCAVELGLTW